MPVSKRDYQTIGRLSDKAIRDEMKRGFTFQEAVKDNRQLTELSESLGANYQPEEFSFRSLFENLIRDSHGDLVGRRFLDSWDPRQRIAGEGASLYEAEVSTANFANIMGQIVYSSVLPAFDSPTLIGSQIARTIPTPFEQEKIPGISNPGDVTAVVPEGHDFPKVGITEHWIETQITQKHGAILQMTKEALFFDRTGLVLSQAAKLSTMLSINKEKRLLDAATGQTSLYKRNGAAAIATYGEDSGSHNWDNLQTSNALVDWTDLENVMLLFDGIVDPDTGEPVFIDFSAMSLIVPTALIGTAGRIVSAIEIQHVDMQVNAATIRTRSANPTFITNLTILSNQYVKDRTSSASTYFIGDFLNAITYRENWPIQTPPEAVSPHDEIHRDIVAGVKVTERGSANVENPRVVAKATA